jgi:cyclopropane fatty-acyl-phospholipid synthase-like methyltransferase
MNDEGGAVSDGDRPDGPLPEPVVPSDVYSEAYYREACAGYAEWDASEGATVAGIYPGILHLARFRPGEVLVDIGTGRGELLAVAVEKGAERAIGIEYAAAAVALANKTLDVHGVTDRAEVLVADARSIPVDDDTADLVTMVDVVEHLAHEELERSLIEALRILKPGGRIFVHTMPSRTLYEITYKLQRAIGIGRRRRWPSNPRLHEYEHLMHVNEQTIGSLRRYLRTAGFDGVRVWVGNWMYTDFVPDERAKRLYHRLAAFPLTRRFGVADLFAEGTKRV